MKKVLLFLLLFVLLVAGVIYYFLFIKQTENKGYVPDHADQIICVHIQKLQNDLFSYVIQHGDELDSLNQGDLANDFMSSTITIPSKLVAYKLKDTGAFFIPFTFQDSLSVLRFFEKYEYALMGGRYVRHKGAFTSVMKWKGNNGVVAFCKNVLNERDIAIAHINDVLMKGYTTSDRIKKKIDQTTAQVEVLQGENSIKLNTTKNNLEISGTMDLSQPSKGVYSLQGLNYTSFNYSFVYSFLMKNVDIPTYSNKWGVPLDTLNNHIENITLAYHGEETVKDSIITYDYDENFEMVEKIQVTEQSQPIFSICIQPKSDVSESWLIKKGLLKETNKGLRFASFPFAPLYKKDTGKVIVFTNKSLQTPDYKENNNGLFSMHLAIDELPLGDLQYLSNHQKEMLTSFDKLLVMLENKSNKGQLTLSLSKKDSEEHMLFLLLQSLKN